MNLKNLIGLATLLLIISCVRATVDTSLEECEIIVAYTVTDGSSGNLEVKSIIDNSCAYSGCHDGINAPRDLREYNDEIFELPNNKDFKSQVFDLGVMPPDTINETRKLSQNDLQTLECWITGGYLNQG